MPDQPASRVTERMVLDALHHRFCRRASQWGRPPRHVLAEHVPLGNRYGDPGRTLDAVAIDCYKGFDGVGVMEPDRGYGVHGIEIKTTRSDLRRELANPTKAAAFTEGWLTTFTLCAPTSVLNHATEMGVPDDWGLLTYRDDGTVRYKRRPATLRDQLTVPMEGVAMLSRAIAKTAWRCTQLHPEEPR